MNPELDLSRKEQIEIDFWRDSEAERPEADSLDVLVNKMGEAKTLLAKIRHFQAVFARSQTILELGAGQGWASCVVKRLFPEAKVIATDISEHAVASIGKWERVFEVKVDETFACKSYEIPVEDGSLDLVFCFEAAHHFVKHRATFAELARVLRPGGAVLYLHEPSCKPYIHKRAHRRVNRKRPSVPEDVLIYSRIQELAEAAGFDVTLRFDPTIQNRGGFETFYYLTLQKARFLQKLLPCSMDYLFVKR
ncbi:MAG TPA: class I SAM-dependent methyltransferase [Fimbriimonadaceae bacterium]|nr:class I SAM-dependent methyltransferase [Fimbriimonadaceae bacterium]